MAVGGPLQQSDYSDIVDRALAEDLAERGDITTAALIGDESVGAGRIVAREAGVIAGLDVAAYVFSRVDDRIAMTKRVDDGDRVDAGRVLAEVEGPAAGMLTAERTALNLLGRMSGVATATALVVAAVAGTGVKISDTRKTVPGLRVLDKYAVRAGGGVNHRFGLYDAVMIKDNHLAVMGDIVRAVTKAKGAAGPGTMILVEVANLEQLQRALATRADRVLLDNMDPPTLRRAVEMAGDRITLEASGGITLDNVRDVADTGVDVISVGWITHSAPQLDVALDFEPSVRSE